MMCLVFVGFYNRFYNRFYNCYTVLMFALLVANWPFCINKFDNVIGVCVVVVRVFLYK